MYAQYQVDVTDVGDGSFAPLRVTAARELIVSVAAGGSLATLQSDTYKNITSGTNLVKSGAGSFARLIVNDPGSTVTATIYDNIAASGTKIATVTLVAGMNLGYGIAFGTGLTVVLSGACDVTITYQ